eukprot:Hpha_TRINITY_DN23334_c0_g1::TRINITY_DN23334_c0_g1_i1::g.96929::m.96929
MGGDKRPSISIQRGSMVRPATAAPRGKTGQTLAQRRRKSSVLPVTGWESPVTPRSVSGSAAPRTSVVERFGRGSIFQPGRGSIGRSSIASAAADKYAEVVVATVRNLVDSEGTNAASKRLETQRASILVSLGRYRGVLRRALARPSRPAEERQALTLEMERAEEAIHRLHNRPAVVLTDKFWALSGPLHESAHTHANRHPSAEWKPGEGLALHGAAIAELVKEREPSMFVAQGLRVKKTDSERFQDSVQCLVMHPEDNSILYAGCSSGRLLVLYADAPTEPAGELPFQMVYGYEVLTCGRVRQRRGKTGSDEVFLCAAGSDKTLRVFNLTRDRVQCVFAGSKAAFSAVLCWRGWLLSATYGQEGVRCWDIWRARCIGEISATARRLPEGGRFDPVCSLAPCGKLLVIGYRSGAIAVGVSPQALGDGDAPPQMRLGHVFNAAESRCRDLPEQCLREAEWEAAGRIGTKPVPRSSPRFQVGHREAINVLSVREDNPRYLYSGGEDGLVIQWDLKSREQRKVMRGHSLGIIALGQCGGDMAASGGKDGIIVLWDVIEGVPLQTLHHDREVHAVLPIFGTPPGWFNQNPVSLTSPGAPWSAVLRSPIARARQILPPDLRLLTTGADKMVSVWEVTVNETRMPSISRAIGLVMSDAEPAPRRMGNKRLSNLSGTGHLGFTSNPYDLFVPTSPVQRWRQMAAPASAGPKQSASFMSGSGFSGLSDHSRPASAQPRAAR